MRNVENGCSRACSRTQAAMSLIGGVHAGDDVYLHRAEHLSRAPDDCVLVGGGGEAHTHEHAGRPDVLDAKARRCAPEVVDQASHEHGLVLALESDLVKTHEDIARLFHTVASGGPL